MIPNQLAAMIALIEADPDVAALTEGRIFGEEVPETETTDPGVARKLVVLQTAGGPGRRDELRVTRQRIDAFCYGETINEADRVRRAVLKALVHAPRQVRSGVLIHWINEGSGTQPLRDRDTGWPLKIQSFMALLSDTEVV